MKLSTLGKFFAKVKDMNDSKTRTISETQVVYMKADLDGVRNIAPWGHEAPSLIPRRELARTADRVVSITGLEQAKLYSEFLGGNSNINATTLPSHPKKVNHRTQ